MLRSSQCLTLPATWWKSFLVTFFLLIELAKGFWENP